MGVGPANLHPIKNSGKNSEQASPAKPPHCGRNHLRDDNRLGLRVGLPHERHIDQIEEIQQPNPGDSGDEVDPAQNDVNDGAGIGGRMERNAGGEWQIHVVPPQNRIW